MENRRKLWRKEEMSIQKKEGKNEHHGRLFVRFAVPLALL